MLQVHHYLCNAVDVDSWCGKGLEIDQYNIVKIIADTINVPQEKIYNDMLDRLTLNPDEALQYGLIHEKKIAPIPAGAKIFSIGESDSPQ